MLLNDRINTILESNIVHEGFLMNDKKSFAIQIGERIRMKIKALNITQKTLAEKIDKSVSCFGQPERGTTLPSIVKLP